MDKKSETLNFAYKYPFSIEAKDIVQSQPNGIDIKYLDMGSRHLEGAISKGIEYSAISIAQFKIDYILAYLYSRMLLSALKRNDLIAIYAAAEARRSSRALLGSDKGEIIKVAERLGIRLAGTFGKQNDKKGADEFSIGFVDYVRYAPRTNSSELVNQRLSNGIVVLDRSSIAKLMEQAVAREIAKGLPINGRELPRKVMEYSKGLRFSIAAKSSKIESGRANEWIERLLETPIADVRHRTVNLILAPYLVNTKGLEVDDASKIISGYIDKCRQLDPSTKINDSYIRYQCAYAKRRGLKPLSLERAKDLLGSQVDLEAQAVK